MSAPEAPTLEGEMWRVAIRDTVCVVMPCNEIRVWWRGGWDIVPLSASEREEVLRAWIMHERARAEQVESTLAEVMREHAAAHEHARERIAHVTERAEKAEIEVARLLAAIERLDDAYLEADDYPAPLRALVRMARK